MEKEAAGISNLEKQRRVGANSEAKDRASTIGKVENEENPGTAAILKWKTIMERLERRDEPSSIIRKSAINDH